MTCSIVLHPGPPKCATSTLQRLFVLEGHALGRTLEVAQARQRPGPQPQAAPAAE